MIGIIDSGVGGLSVVKEMQNQGVHIPFVYLGDGANVPYGVRTPEEITKLSIRLVQYLVDTYQINRLVIACNTIVSASIDEIKRQFPRLPIDNIVSHGALAAGLSFSEQVTVLSTNATAKSQIYSRTISEYNEDVSVQELPASELVMLVENNEVDMEVVQKNIKKIHPKTDILILGCTHFPFLYEAIRASISQDIRVVDPAYSCVMYLKQEFEDIEKTQEGSIFLTTGEKKQFTTFMNEHEIEYLDGHVHQVELREE